MNKALVDAAPMAEERETAQWYAAGGISGDAAKSLLQKWMVPELYRICFHFGGLKMWNGLPEAARHILRIELHRIRTAATAPHLFEEIPGNRPILKDKCNQCGADRDAPIHQPDDLTEAERDESIYVPKGYSNMQVIDLTPESLKTPEGQEKVARTLRKFDDSAADVANRAKEFFDQYEGDIRSMFRRFIENHGDDGGNYAESIEELDDLKEAMRRRSEAQDNFLRALAGR